MKKLICIFKGHRLGKRKWGWEANPFWDGQLGFEQDEPATRPCKYWTCKRCGAVFGEE